MRCLKGAKDAVLSNIKYWVKRLERKMAGHAEVTTQKFQELVKHMSDAEREALIEAVDRAQREEL